MLPSALFCFVAALVCPLACPLAMCDKVASSPAENVLKQPDKMRNVVLDERGRLSLVKGDKGYAADGEFLSRPIAAAGNGKVRVDWIEQWTGP